MPETPQNCACDPNPSTTEGPVPWCDFHGQPSAAYEAGYQAAIRDMRANLNLLGSVSLHHISGVDLDFRAKRGGPDAS